MTTNENHVWVHLAAPDTHRLVSWCVRCGTVRRSTTQRHIIGPNVTYQTVGELYESEYAPKCL